jgi:hypothetical protein
VTLRGANIATEFEALLADYIEKRFGAVRQNVNEPAE